MVGVEPDVCALNNTPMRKPVDPSSTLAKPAIATFLATITYELLDPVGGYRSHLKVPPEIWRDMSLYEGDPAFLLTAGLPKLPPHCRSVLDVDISLPHHRRLF